MKRPEEQMEAEKKGVVLLPDDGWKHLLMIPRMFFTRTDFPEPEAPMITRDSDSMTSKFIPFKT